jgi:hypothetical protein
MSTSDVSVRSMDGTTLEIFREVANRADDAVSVRNSS